MDTTLQPTSLDELGANLDYLNKRCEAIIAILTFMENTSVDVRRFDLKTKEFSHYYDYLTRALLLTETERVIIRNDYERERQGRVT